jgi:hypothetical protein
MIGATDVAAARALWKNSETPVHQRCLAARANGLLGKHGPSWIVEGVPMEDRESPLARARDQGTRDAERRRSAERRAHEIEEATARMRSFGIESVAEAMIIVQKRSERAEIREAAVASLGELRFREAVGPLIEALREGQQQLSGMCMTALTAIGSRRHARRLMDIVRGAYPLPARQEALYTLWHLRELRAESLFIRVSGNIEKEEEHTRDMATEALGNTWWHPPTQRALSERLFDPSVSVRFAALCAVRTVNPRTLTCLRTALLAKLADTDRVDDNRVIAQLAERLLCQACPATSRL